MAHKDWCGQPCADCENPCALDESMPCSPNCESLNEDGTRDVNACIWANCDAYEISENTCPVCGNGELEYGNSAIDEGELNHEWVCPYCGSVGTEVSKLEFSTHLVSEQKE